MDKPDREQLIAAALRNAHEAEQRIDAARRANPSERPTDLELAKAHTEVAVAYASIANALS